LRPDHGAPHLDPAQWSGGGGRTYSGVCAAGQRWNSGFAGGL